MMTRSKVVDSTASVWRLGVVVALPSRFVEHHGRRHRDAGEGRGGYRRGLLCPGVRGRRGAALGAQRPGHGRRADARHLAAAARLIRESRRPLIFAGGGVRYSDATDALRCAEAILRRDECIPRESFKASDRVRAYSYDVRKETRGPQIFLSRTHPQFMAKLFTMEVPEIYDGIIEIRSVARDPGSRAKIAVISRDSSIDPVGACVGMRGSRVQAVVGELQGEKIDIIPWNDNAATFIVNALQPAEVAKVVLDEDAERIEVVVPDAQLSLAIGRKGQNVRLASQLTGWDIDIMTEASESERRQAEFAERSAMFMEALDVDEMVGQVLASEGFAEVEEIAYVDLDEISSIDGFDEETATEIQTRAREYLERIEAIDGTLHSYITVCRQEALQAARAAEQALARGEHRGPLHGVPYAVKDQFWTKGILTTGGSIILGDFVPQEDATVVARLNAAGAVLLGKLNMSEFATGNSVHHPYGTPHWRDYHHRFRRHYGPAALVPVTELLADSGLGLPATFLGSAREPGLAPRAERDAVWLGLIQEAMLDHRDEVVLTPADRDRLAAGTDLDVHYPPRIEICAEVRARSIHALHRGDFRLTVTGAPRPANSMAGRFARLLDDAQQRGVPTRVAADRAWVGVRQITACGARRHLAANPADGLGQPLRDVCGLLQQVERESLGGFTPDAGELGQLRHELLDGGHGKT